MKISKTRLKQIIKEELETLLQLQEQEVQSGTGQTASDVKTMSKGEMRRMKAGHQQRRAAAIARKKDQEAAAEKAAQEKAAAEREERWRLTVGMDQARQDAEKKSAAERAELQQGVGMALSRSGLARAEAEERERERQTTGIASTRAALKPKMGKIDLSQSLSGTGISSPEAATAPATTPGAAPAAAPAVASGKKRSKGKGSGGKRRAINAMKKAGTITPAQWTKARRAHARGGDAAADKVLASFGASAGKKTVAKGASGRPALPPLRLGPAKKAATGPKTGDPEADMAVMKKGLKTDELSASGQAEYQEIYNTLKDQAESDRDATVKARAIFKKRNRITVKKRSAQRRLAKQKGAQKTFQTAMKAKEAGEAGKRAVAAAAGQKPPAIAGEPVRTPERQKKVDAFKRKVGARGMAGSGRRQLPGTDEKR